MQDFIKLYLQTLMKNSYNIYRSCDVMHKFEKIYQDLKEKILSGTYPIKSLLPSENQLANQHNVSRETIRRAQNQLIREGLILKHKGKGALVLDYQQFSLPITGLTSYKELTSQQNIKSQTKVLRLDQISTPDFLIGLYDIQQDEKFFHLVRTRSVDGSVLIIDEDYLRCKYVPELNKQAAKESLYNYFENILKLEISYAAKEFYPEIASELDQEQMQISDNSYVITVSSHVFLKDSSFFQYTQSRHRMDKFYFKEIAHRRRQL